MDKHEYVERADPEVKGYEIATRRRNNLINRYVWANEWICGITLDIPCGMGWGTPFLTNASRIIGIDVHRESINRARNYYLHAAFQTGNMLYIDYPNNFFDSVICCEGYEHLTRNDQYRLMEELHRVVKNKGKVLLTIPLARYKGDHTGNKFHLYEPTFTEAMDTFSEKFEIIEYRDYNVGWFVLEAIK